MQLKDIIEYKIYTAPDGFGVSEVEKWLKDIPAISSFDEIEPFFGNNDFSFNEWFALIVIIRNKYINPVTINNDFSSNYEMRANTALSSQQYLDLNLKEDKSGVLDFSAQKNLRRLILTSCRICESIILPENSNLELIEILNMPKLKHIKNLDSLKSLKSLALNK